MKTSLLLLLLHLTFVSYGQGPTLSQDTDFKDGVYLSYQDFAANNPSILLFEISFEEKDDVFCYQRILGDFVTSPSLQLDLDTVQIWGICINGRPYINIANRKKPHNYKKGRYLKFIRLMLIGNLCLCTDEGDVDAPNQPILYPDPNNDLQSYPSNTNKRGSITRFILKTTTGKIVRFDPDLFLDLIKDDTHLYNEFRPYSYRVGRKEILAYLVRYNQRNPISISHLPSSKE